MPGFLKRAMLWKRIARLERKVGGSPEQLAGISVHERIDRLTSTVERLARELDSLKSQAARQDETGTKLRADVEELQRLQRVSTVMDWIAQATLKTRPLVSVILPTKDRVDLLPRAIGDRKSVV